MPRNMERALLVAGRREARRQIGRLGNQRVAQRTLERYLNAVSRFLSFLAVQSAQRARDYDELDAQLAEWVEACWWDGEARALAADTLSGVSFLLRVRRRFQASWNLLSTWQRLEMPDRAPPMPLEVIMALAGKAMHQQRPDVAAVLLLSFHCMLRTMEGLCARVGHIALDSNYIGVVALPLTKIGQQRGAQEVVSISDPVVGRFLARAMQGRGPEETLLRMSPLEFRRWFTSALQELGLAAFRFRPYSIRRGGATFDYQRGNDIASTCFRGRWGSSRTARIYVTDGLALLTSMHFSAAIRAQLQRFAAYL